MRQFQVSDSVKLTEALQLVSGETVPTGSPGTIVEVLNTSNTYRVELLGRWVRAELDGGFFIADPSDDPSYLETIGVETVHHHQIQIVKPAHELADIRGQLLALIDELPETKLKDVRDFAEFLKSRPDSSTNPIKFPAE
jgi:hypothetical protein